MRELRLATELDFDFFYTIKSEEKNMYWTGHDCRPNKDTLKDWFINKLVPDSDRDIFFYFIDSKAVGYSYAIYNENFIETAVSVLMRYEGLGYGKEIVRETLEYCRGKEENLNFHAWIFENNIPSIKVHTSVGFTKTEDYKMLATKKMYKYEC